jgi:hypothetical protein
MNPIGEMGGTVMSHPGQYLKIYDMIRSGWKTPATLQVSASQHDSAACACHD